MIKCPKCFYDNQDNYVFCMQCGYKLKEDESLDETVYAEEESGISDLPAEEIPKTRVVQTLEGIEAMDQGAGSAKTKVFKPAETRINPQLVEIKDDSTEGKIYEITKISTNIGRRDGDITFPSDTYLSPNHCLVTFEDGKLFIEDLSSYNGIFLKIKDKTPLTSGAYILIGQQLLQFFPFTYKDLLVPDKLDTEDIVNFYGVSNRKIIALIKQIFSDRSEGNRYFITNESVSIGRQAGDILFPDDKFMSNRHTVITKEGKDFFIIDNDSSNGVFIQVVGKVELKDGDFLLLGKQLFEYRAPTQ